MIKTPRAWVLLLGILGATGSAAQETPPALVQVEQVRAGAIERSLPLSGRIHSRHDTAMSLTLSGELDWVLEPGTRVTEGEVLLSLWNKDRKAMTAQAMISSRQSLRR